MPETAELAPAEMNIASIMAKQGVMVNEGAETTVPDIKVEQQPASPAATTEKVETTSEPAKEKPAAVQETKPVTETKTEIPKQETQAATQDWKEVLKQQSATEVLKALGFDDNAAKFISERKTVDPKIANLIKHWETKGEVKPYFEALSTNYDEMSDEDVMRRQLQEKFPKFTKDELNALYEKRVTLRYELDPDLFDETKRKAGLIELKADASEYREVLKGKQQEYILNSPPEPQKSQAEIEYTEKLTEGQKAFDAYKDYLTVDPYIKGVLSEKKITIGEGEEAYNYVPEKPEELVDLLLNQKKWFSKLHDDKNIPNTKKQLLMAALVNDDNFLSLLATHFKAVGANTLTKQIENPSDPKGTTSAGGTSEEDPAKAMAMHGKMVAG